MTGREGGCANITGRSQSRVWVPLGLQGGWAGDAAVWRFALGSGASQGHYPRLRPSAGGQAGLGRPHGALGVLWGSVPPWDQSWSVFICVLSRRKGPGAERRGGLWGEYPRPSRLPKHHSLLTRRRTHGRRSRGLSGSGPRSGKWERGRSDSGDCGPTLQTQRPPSVLGFAPSVFQGAQRDLRATGFMKNP